MTDADAPLNSDAVKNPMSTRRGKRKNDELEKPSAGKSRRRNSARNSNGSGKQAQLSPAAVRNGSSSKVKPLNKVRKSTRKDQGVKKRSAISKQNLTNKQQEQVLQLLQKANVDSNLLTSLEAQINSDDDAVTSRAGDESEFDTDSSPKRNTPSRTAAHSPPKNPRRVSTRRRSREQVIPEDVDDFEGQNPGEFHREQFEDAEDNEKLDDDHDDNRHLDEQADDDEHPAPVFDRSDEEQEVSFDINDERQNASNEDGTHAQVPISTQNEIPSPSRPPQFTDIMTVAGRGDTFQEELPAPTAGFDDSVLMNTIALMQRSITSSVEASSAQLLAELRAEREDTRRLREHVSELTSIITTTAVAMFNKQPSSNPRVKEMQRKLCLLPALFNDSFMLKILPRVVVGFIANDIEEGSAYSSLEEKGVQYLCVLYFARRPKERKKEKFASEVGRVYSKIRFGLMMSSFLAMQSNSFQTFKAKRTQGENHGVTSITDNEISTVNPNVSAIDQPFYLEPGYVLREHCSTAAKKLENRGEKEAVDESQSGDTSSQALDDDESTDMQESTNSSSTKQKATKTGPLTQTEIATEAAAMVYRIITATLYRSRPASKLQLFHDVTYLFIGWSQFEAPVDQASLKMNWEASLTRDIAYIDNLPRMKLVKPQGRRSGIGKDADQVDIHNLTHLETLISNHPELSLIIEHNVIVDTAIRQLRYRMNLLEVACRFLASYISIESAAKGKDALCVDRYALKAIVVLALGFRRLMEEAIGEMKIRKCVPWKDNVSATGKQGRPRRTRPRSDRTSSGYTTYNFPQVQGMTVESLLPAASKQKEVLNKMILNMTEEEFNSRMVNSTGGSNLRNGVGSSAGRLETSRIQADETQGVFGF